MSQGMRFVYLSSLELLVNPESRTGTKAGSLIIVLDPRWNDFCKTLLGAVTAQLCNERTAGYISPNTFLPLTEETLREAQMLQVRTSSLRGSSAGSRRVEYSWKLSYQIMPSATNPGNPPWFHGLYQAQKNTDRDRTRLVMDPAQIQLPISWTMSIYEDREDDRSSCHFMQPRIEMMYDNFGFMPASPLQREKHSYKNDRMRALSLEDFTLEDHRLMWDKWIRKVAKGKTKDSLLDCVYGHRFWASSLLKESKVSISQEEIPVSQRGIVAVLTSREGDRDSDPNKDSIPLMRKERMHRNICKSTRRLKSRSLKQNQSIQRKIGLQRSYNVCLIKAQVTWATSKGMIRWAPVKPYPTRRKNRLQFKKLLFASNSTKVLQVKEFTTS